MYNWDLNWEVHGRPLDLRQPDGIWRPMDISRVSLSMALQGTDGCRRTTCPKRECLWAWMSCPMWGWEVNLWIALLVTWSCRRTPRMASGTSCERLEEPGSTPLIHSFSVQLSLVPGVSVQHPLVYSVPVKFPQVHGVPVQLPQVHSVPIKVPLVHGVPVQLSLIHVALHYEISSNSKPSLPLHLHSDTLSFHP